MVAVLLPVVFRFGQLAALNKLYKRMRSSLGMEILDRLYLQFRQEQAFLSFKSNYRILMILKKFFQRIIGDDVQCIFWIWNDCAQKATALQRLRLLANR